MSDPAASLPTLDAVSQAIESMNALTAKLDGFITSQADRRRRDKRVIGGFVIVLLVAIGGTWYSSNKAANVRGPLLEAVLIQCVRAAPLAAVESVPNPPPPAKAA